MNAMAVYVLQAKLQNIFPFIAMPCIFLQEGSPKWKLKKIEE